MGTYDTFLDPVTGEGHQSKAFGKNQKTYRLGDAVKPQRAPLSEFDYSEDSAGRRGGAIPGLPSGTFQAQVAHAADGECYIDVTDGIFTGISATRDAAVPLIDHYGRLIERAAPAR